MECCGYPFQAGCGCLICRQTGDDYLAVASLGSLVSDFAVSVLPNETTDKTNRKKYIYISKVFLPFHSISISKLKYRMQSRLYRNPWNIKQSITIIKFINKFKNENLLKIF